MTTIMGRVLSRSPSDTEGCEGMRGQPFTGLGFSSRKFPSCLSHSQVNGPAKEVRTCTRTEAQQRCSGAIPLNQSCSGLVQTLSSRDFVFVNTQVPGSFGEGSVTPHSHCLTYTSMNVLVKETAQMIKMVFPTQQPNACRLARTPNTTSHSGTRRVGKEHSLFIET